MAYKTQPEIDAEIATLKAKRANAPEFSDGIGGKRNNWRELDAAIAVLEENLDEAAIKADGNTRFHDAEVTIAYNTANWRDNQEKDEHPVSMFHFSQLVGLLLLLLTLVVGGFGCAGLDHPTPDQMASYVADARDVAELGTTAALLEDESLRHELTLARDSLAAIESLPDGTVTVDDLLRSLSKLPIERLQSAKAKIYISGGRIIVRRFTSWVTSSQVDVGASGYVKQFAKALREGIDAALGVPVGQSLKTDPSTMSWFLLVRSNDRVPDAFVPQCPRCAAATTDDAAVLASYPPLYRARCPACGWSGAHL